MASTDSPMLDYAALRARAIASVQRLAADTWTDHNSHDPGITILEQLCFALTDLGYRTAFDMPDLLAGGDAGQSGLFTPAQVLTSAPVTLDDLRRLVIDVAGVKNAWIEPLDIVVGSFDAALNTIAPPLPLGGAPPSPNLSALSVRGLYRVNIEKSGWGQDVDGGLIVQRASQRLQRYRNLGEDFAVVRVLDPQPVALDMALELDPAGDVVATLASLYEVVADYMAPTVPLRSLRQMLDAGARVDEVFEGPLLDRGFIAAADLDKAARRDSLRLSDLIHLLMDLPGVLAVKSLKFIVNGTISRDWLRSVDADRCASFDIAGSAIRLHRRGVRVDQPSISAQAQARFGQRMAQAAAQSVRVDPQRDLAAPVGRDRQVARYHSLLHGFPQAWGIGPAGLADSVPEQRKAQALQLKAYLQCFDQLLANQFAQLGQARRLFALDDAGADSYFSQPVPDPDGALGLAALRMGDGGDGDDGASYARRLAAITEDPWGNADRNAPPPPAGFSPPGLARRNQVLDHLLARFGEQFANHTLLLPDGRLASADPPLAVLVRDKQAFLRDLPRIGHDRGVGSDLLARADSANLGGLVLRLTRRFGLHKDVGPLADDLRRPPPEGDRQLGSGPALTDERFHLVEHLLLRPQAEDQAPGPSLLRAALAPDPYSLQLTLVFAGTAGRLADANFRSFVEQTVQDEAPAHLGVRVLWFDALAFGRFEATFSAFSEQWRATGLARLGLGDAPAGSAQAPLRSQRNRLIDQLGLGDTAPLADLHLSADKIKVAFGTSAVVSIEDAEADVDYELRGPDGLPLKYKDAAAAAAAVRRSGGQVEITTPAITDDITLRVRALKRYGAVGPRWLNTPVAVKVGLDLTLAIELRDCAVLDPQVATPQPGDARLVDYGRSVDVQIDASQEGVEYQLVLGATELPDVAVGKFSDITLATGPVTEDVVIAVKATKRFPASSKRSDDSSLLNARLFLKVRANPAIDAALLPAAVVDHHQATTLRLPASQASVSYRLLLRRIRDSEWLRDPASPGLAPLAADLPWVAAPPRADAYTVPDGFVVLGEAVPGNGAALDLALPPPEFDGVVVLQGIKSHTANPSARQVSSQVLLTPNLMWLVRPDTQAALRLQIGIDGDHTVGELALAGGQPGVFYSLLPLAGAAPTLPGYFHQRDDRNPVQNKGLEQLALGLDFAVAGDPANALPGLANPATVAPLDPSLVAPAWPLGTELTVWASRAQTGLQAMLAKHAIVAPLPTIALAAEVLDFGASAQVTVRASVKGERYQLRHDDRWLDAPRSGTGANLKLSSDPVTSTAPLVLAASGGDDASLTLTRLLRLALVLRPDTSLAVSVRDAQVSAGAATQVLIQASEPDVRYQLMVGDSLIGGAVAGNGGELALDTGPVSAATGFQVNAIRGGEVRSSVRLAASISVALKA